MILTGRPLIVLGMVTAPPEPVYPVMVIAPLLVVMVNWAFTTVGSVKSSTSGSSVAHALLKCPIILFRRVLLAGGALGRTMMTRCLFTALEIPRKGTACKTKPGESGE